MRPVFVAWLVSVLGALLASLISSAQRGGECKPRKTACASRASLRCARGFLQRHACNAVVNKNKTKLRFTSVDVSIAEGIPMFISGNTMKEYGQNIGPPH